MASPLLALLAALQASAPHQQPLPRLVVHITIDQFRADYLERWRAQLTGGLARLLERGAVFTDAYQDHAMAETAPGHATVLSGRNPRSTGIVRNAFGVTDNNETGELLDVTGPGASPWRFRGTALFDWMQARWPGARALSVSRKDRGAILPIGRARQQAYWYQSGQFTTSRYYADSLPKWVRDFNAGLLPARAPGRRWDLLLDPSAYAEPDSMDYENGGKDVVFPHVLPPDTTAAADAFIATPWMDSLTLALALNGVVQLHLGSGGHPDLLAVSLSATDYIGHAFGPDSREIHDQVLHVDRYLGAFLDSLDRLFGRDGYVVSVTADHGMTSYPEYANRHGTPGAQWLNPSGLIRADSVALAQQLGPHRWIRFFELGLLVVDRPGLVAHGVAVDALVHLIANEMRQAPQVLRVDTPETLAAADTATDAVARRWRNAIPPDLPAALMVTLKPHMVWGSGGEAQHGQPSDDDTHVPLVIAGPGVRPGRYAQRVQVADLAPTLARLVGVEPLEKLDGRVLVEALDR
ncbi:MAG TPA: alkaline phosphatase family protein [Gemmatimonadales bacterium]|nr:alkaline phosphatase family protein [Gemmatimonadales bacterium]